ncbi:Conserved_hypothetical protein [Hexamita inflata]|uniref:Uncharacterized protein n=1 Tax=Hexamita inflata TaxID=28002 RepID=A0AA86S5U3_9EUKA|nr:Conserved hypothetical protein [Hexamita inflata]
MNENTVNKLYDAKMTRRYEGKIKDGVLEIAEDPEVTNLQFLEKLDIFALNLCISNGMSVKLRSNTLQIISVYTLRDQDAEQQQRLNWNINDLELENLEVLNLRRNSLENDQLYNLAKFKKLHVLDVSFNKVDLTHIHNISSLTNLNMQRSGLKNIDLISSLVNLVELDLSENFREDTSSNDTDLSYLYVLNISFNTQLDFSPLCKLKSLTKLNMCQCGLTNIDKITSLVNLDQLDLSQNRDINLSSLYQVRSLTQLYMYQCNLKNIDQITQLINLEVLNISDNSLLTINSIDQLVNLKKLYMSLNNNIDITPLKSLVGLITLNVNNCGLKQLTALKHLINLQTLDISFNYDINISELQYLKNLKYLNLKNCKLVSIYVLSPLVNLEYLNLAENQIVYLDANVHEMTNLKEFQFYCNLVSDLSSIEQHQNFNNIDENNNKCFNISDQNKYPSEEQLFNANKMRRVESPNIQLKEIQIQHKALQTALNNFEQEVKATTSNAWQSQIQFTANVVRLFQQLNQVGFE